VAPVLVAPFGLAPLRLAPLNMSLVLEPRHRGIGGLGSAGNAEQQHEAVTRKVHPIRRNRSEPAAIGSVIEGQPASSVFARETNGAVRDRVPNYPPGTGLVIEFS